MDSRTMVRRVLTSVLALVALGSSLLAAPGRAETRETWDDSASVQLVQVQAGRYGPFATLRRANEIADHFRGRGYNAHAYPEWGVYYVNVW